MWEVEWVHKGSQHHSTTGLLPDKHWDCIQTSHRTLSLTVTQLYSTAVDSTPCVYVCVYVCILCRVYIKSVCV